MKTYRVCIVKKSEVLVSCDDNKLSEFITNLAQKLEDDERLYVEKIVEVPAFSQN